MSPLSAELLQTTVCLINIPASADLNNLVLLGEKLRNECAAGTELGQNVAKILDEVVPELQDQLDTMESVAPAYNVRTPCGPPGNGFYCFIRVNRNVIRKLTGCLLALESTSNRGRAALLQDLDYWIKYTDKAV